jgi:hypothetical protein
VPPFPCFRTSPTLGQLGQSCNPIKTWNFVNTQVEFNGWERKFAFLQADVLCPIFGLDFLRFFGMQANPSSSEILVPALSQRAQEGGEAEMRPMFIFLPRKRCQSLSRKPPPVLALFITGLVNCWRSSQTWSCCRRRPPSRITGWSTISSLPVGLFLPRLSAWSRPRGRWQATLEKAGIVFRSTSAWASPLHMVPKKDGSWRP